MPHSASRLRRHESGAGQPLVIAIDGPAGAGKSTAARALARRLGFFLLDTGAIYRTVALAASRRGVAFDDGEALGQRRRGAAPSASTRPARVLVADEDVSTAHPHARDVAGRLDGVGASAGARRRCSACSASWPPRGRCVVEGRDIGTVVLPWAPLKIFLTASPEVRARRRYDELVAKGQTVDLDKTLAEILERDERDSNRATAPLKQADDAVLLDTSALGEAAVVDRMEALARARFGADLP